MHRSIHGSEAREVRLSRVHLRIRNDAGRCFVEDLGSKNDTFVDGEPIGAPVELRDQALIRAGRVLLVFQADAGPLLSAECPIPAITPA